MGTREGLALSATVVARVTESSTHPSAGPRSDEKGGRSRGPAGLLLPCTQGRSIRKAAERTESAAGHL
jgi:hypothetical protein